MCFAAVENVQSDVEQAMKVIKALISCNLKCFGKKKKVEKVPHKV